LREGIVKSQKDFTKEVDVLGKIRHPNLLALRAYYWGPKDEKLLVYDYMPGGSLAAFLHGMFYHHSLIMFCDVFLDVLCHGLTCLGHAAYGYDSELTVVWGVCSKRARDGSGLGYED
jgi:serine/threonine protein kinase